MLRKTAALGLALLLMFAVSEAACDVLPPWHYGMESYTLDNGLRVILRHNPSPPGRLEFRLVVLAGSVHDKEDKAGTAHFVEHMAFKGSTHIPTGEIRTTQYPMGANTFYTHTQYYVRTSYENRDDVKTAAVIIDDFMHGILFPPDQVEKERNVILNEIHFKKIWNNNANTSKQHAAEFLSEQMGKSANWLTVTGTNDSVNAISRDDLLEFYRKWYVPERMALVVVGDLPVSEIKEIIGEAIQSAEFPARPGAPRDLSLPALGQITLLAPAASDESDDSLYMLVRRDTHGVADKKDLAHAITDWLILDAVTTRASRSESGAAGARIPFGLNFKPFLFVPDAHMLSFEIPFDLVKTMSAAERVKAHLREIQSLVRHGLLDTEIAESKKRMLKTLARQSEYPDNASSMDLADAAAGALASGIVYTTQDAADIRKCIAGLDANAVNRRVRSLFDSGNISLIAVSNTQAKDVIDQEKLQELYQEVLAEDIPAPVQPAPAVISLKVANPPAPGEIKERRNLTPMDTERVTFSNGVTLYVKRTDFRKGRVLVRSFRRINPHRYESWQNAGITTITEEMLKMGGTRAYSREDLDTLFREEDFFLEPGLTYSGGGNTGNLEDILKLVYLHATEPELSEDDLKPAKIRAGYEYHDKPEDAVTRELMKVLCPGNYRTAAVSQSFLEQFTREDIEAWWRDTFHAGPQDFAIVGDVDTEAAIALAAQYLGALPPIRPITGHAPLDHCSFPRGYTLRELPYPYGEGPWAFIFFEGQQDFIQDPRMQAAAIILKSRLWNHIREKLSLSYVVSAEIYSLLNSNVHGIEIIYNTLEQSREAARLEVNAVIQDLAENGPDDEELSEAVRTLQSDFQESLADNTFWADLLSSGQVTSELMKRKLRIMEEYQALDKKDVADYFKEFLSQDKSRIEIIIE